MQKDADTRVIPLFFREGIGVYQVLGEFIDDLNEAINYASANSADKITLVQSGSVSGDYTIPTGITLLIPNDEAAALSLDSPRTVARSGLNPPVEYRRLVLTENSSITVNGAINIDAYMASDESLGAPAGNYGAIEMQTGSKITINNVASLYAWGYVFGSGTVDVKSGGQTYECLQVGDFKGGSRTIGFIGNSQKVFPFIQYYVQNIEVATTYEFGASAKIRTAFKEDLTPEVTFIGNDGNAFFLLSEGSKLVKTYIPEVDRMNFDLYGNAALTSLTASFAGMPISSKDYVLSINNNFTLNINSGTTSIDSTVEFLPGSEVTIAEGATVILNEGNSVYAYDLDEWDRYVFKYSYSFLYSPAEYSPTRPGQIDISKHASVRNNPMGATTARTEADLRDVKVDINGTLISNGFIYTTAGGANITSSQGTGKISLVNGVNPNPETLYQLNPSDFNTFVEIPITPAKLRNGEQYVGIINEFTETAEVEAGTEFIYNQEFDMWLAGINLTWNNADGTTLDNLTIGSTDAIPAYSGTEPTKASTNELDFAFSGWSEPEISISKGIANFVYTAQYTESDRLYKVTFKDEDGTVLQELDLKYQETPIYSAAEPTKESTVDKDFAFMGWDTDIIPVVADVVYTAQYVESTRLYPIKWVDGDGKELLIEDVAYGTLPVYNGAEPTKIADAQYTYSFNGKWSPIVTEVSGAATYTAEFDSTINTYTVKWNVEGTVVETDENVEYGSNPEFNGETPRKASTIDMVYTFDKWSPEIAVVTADVEYKAVFNETTRKYTVSWLDDQGNVLLTKELAYGETPIYDGAEPTKEATAQYSYTFADWDKAAEAVSGEQTYTATFTEKINQYEIIWLNHDGTELARETVDYGIKPMYSATTPTKASDTINDYVFNGKWLSDNGIELSDTAIVEGNMTLTAQFDAFVKKSTIIFYDENSNVLATVEAEHGKLPVFPNGEPVKEHDDTYNYIFSGWLPKLVEVTGPKEYYAVFTPQLKVYDVQWLDNEGNVLQEATGVTKESEPKFDDINNSLPSKESTEEYEYEFNEWVRNVDPESGDITYTPSFNSIKRSYDITWVNENGIELLVTNVEYGKMPVFEGEELIKDADAMYSYTFAGWVEELVAVTGPATYTAKYTAELNKYTIVWTNADGTVLETDIVEHGTLPEFNGATPTKAEDVRATYTFDSWSPEIVAAVADAEYLASFTETIKSYTVSWLNHAGTVLETVEFSYGEVPSYTGETPVKESTVDKDFTFSGWNQEPVAVVGDASYIAQYSESTREYVVKFVDHNGDLLEEQTVAYGSRPTEPAVPDWEDAQYVYEFTSWSPSVLPVTKDTTYTAQYEPIETKKYTITWLNDDGTVIDTTEVEYGNMPVHADPVKESSESHDFSFDTWEPALVEVTEDASYKASFSERLRKYIIKFVNEDGTLLASKTVEHGQIPTYTSTSAKASTARTSYKFVSWDSELVAATENKTYTAVFEETIHTFTVTWVNEDGTVLEIDENVEYGATPIYDAAEPSKESSVDKHFKFNTWTPVVSTVTADVTYTATYFESDRLYSVVWKDEAENNLAVEQYKYGELPEFKGVVPEKDANEQFTYEFKGWTPEITEVTDSVAYITEYTPILRRYTVKWLNEDGSLIKEDTEVPYGDLPVYEGVTPTKGEDDEFSYEFKEWSPNPSVIEGDAEYTAIFESIPKIKYELRFDANQGLGTMDSIWIVADSTINLPENIFTRENYKFVAWNTAADGSGETYEDLAEFIASEELTVLYAQWEYTDGWLRDDNGKTYIVNGEKVYFNEWQEIDGKKYYFDDNSYVVTGMQEVNTTAGDTKSTYVFNEESGALEEILAEAAALAPVETTPAETTPAETTPAETTPAETTSVETTPEETTPVESDLLVDANNENVTTAAEKPADEVTKTGEATTALLLGITIVVLALSYAAIKVVERKRD